METRRLGPHGPPVSRLGLGLAALGRPAYHTLAHGTDFPEGRSPEQMRRRAHAVLDAAFAAGIRYVDAARSYGRAEEFVRSWLEERRLAPSDLVVGSKWGYRYTGAWRLETERHEVKDHSLSAFRSQSTETLDTLGPYLALYQIHSATPESPVLHDAPVLDELARLRDRGVRIGVTVSGTRQADVVRTAIEIERGGAPLFDAIQATWNLLEPSCEPALREAHAAGRAVLVKEPLANGRLTARGDAGSAGPLAELAAARGVAPDAVALAAALAQPWAGRVLLGPATVDQLRSNLRALDVALAPAELDALGRLVEPAEAYWSRRAGLRWT
jgi:aryl-alcohol dehydrogenase-like predicted oxidoreductase